MWGGRTVPFRPRSPRSPITSSVRVCVVHGMEGWGLHWPCPPRNSTISTFWGAKPLLIRYHHYHHDRQQGALSFGLSLYYKAGYILSTMFVATEASTPFINARWHMHEGQARGAC